MANSVQLTIAEQISKIGPAVQGKIVDIMVERELDKRSTAFVQVMDKLSKLEKDMKKIRPDMVFYNGEGKVASENFSKAKIDERGKLTQQIEKLTKALNKALEQEDFGDVYQLATSNDSKPDKSGDSEETAGSTDRKGHQSSLP
jgi:hypothetical protein